MRGSYPQCIVHQPPRKARARNSPPWRRPSWSMPWPTPGEMCHSDRHLQRGEALRRMHQRLHRDQRVLVAMHQQHRRPCCDFGGELVRGRRPRQPPACRNSRRSPSARPRGASRHAATSWCLGKSRPAPAPRAASLQRASSASRKSLSTGAAMLTPAQRSPGSRKVSGNHSRPIGAWPHGRGACGETKAASGSSAGPGPANVDQVVAVGAVAVQENDELLGRCPERGSIRGPSRSAIAFSFSLAFFASASPFSACFCLPGCDRHHVALLHRVIIGPQQMRRHAAPRPPGLGHLGQRLGVRPLAQAEGDARRIPARRGRRRERHRNGRGRTADRCRRSTARCRAAR